VADNIKANNPDFDVYRSQKECPVSQTDCAEARGDAKAGWNLDKYKFLNMMERTWEMRPNMEWYVFAEADTYIVWPNLVEWLRTKVNSTEKSYFGSVSLLDNVPFAHGGSGYVISGTLLKHLIENNPGVANLYSHKATEHCCGDLILGLALKDRAGVKLKNAHPMFNGEKPISLPFGPGHWCEPILTMHHMNSEEISTLWQFEQTRKGNVGLPLSFLCLSVSVLAEDIIH
jgi:hypothetical protein